jgi:hypothetical protein
MIDLPSLIKEGRLKERVLIHFNLYAQTEFFENVGT